MLALFKCGKLDNAGCMRRDRQSPRGPGRRHWLWMVVDKGPVAGILRCRHLGKSEMRRKKRLGARPGRSNQLCIVRPDGIQFAHGASYRLGHLTSPAWLSLGLQLSYEDCHEVSFCSSQTWPCCGHRAGCEKLRTNMASVISKSCALGLLYFS